MHSQNQIWVKNIYFDVDNTTETVKDSDKPLEEEENGFDADNYVDEDDISEGLYGEER